MKIKISRLRQIISEEIRRSKQQNLNLLAEGHAMITAEELAAWKEGNWSFVSEDSSKDLDDENLV